ncbi:MAG: T9SS type A sorting domain-containing protein [Chitinophagaceae bacterium]|nr:T9SS type A sorting domain-containing protein [Chitinophagaceae bacterium]
MFITFLNSVPCFLTAQCYNLTYSSIINSNPTANIGTGVYYMDNDVYINSNITITDAEILVAPGKKIIINNGSLTINGCHFYGCTEMWGGIEMQQNATLIIDKTTTHNNTLIEDANVAIDAFVTHTGFIYNNFLSVKNTIFNRNKIGIDLKAYQADAMDMVPYNMEISSSIFTCRDIPFTPQSNNWVSISNFKAKAYIPYKSPYINDNLFSATNTNAYLKLPAATNTKSERGVTIALHYPYKGLFKIGNTNNGEETIFDNQTRGVQIWDADVRVNNCTFQHTPGSNPNTETYGLLAEHYDEAKYRLITTPTNANRNMFVDCKYAIVSNYITNAIIEGNTIISSKTAALNNVQEGREGITVRTSTIENFLATHYSNEVSIKGNRIINVAYGITLNYEDVPWNMDPANPIPNPTNPYIPYLLNKIEIYYNEMGISLDPLGTPIPNPNFFINQGITCNVNVGTGTPPFNTLIWPLRLYKNSMTLVNNGILCKNWNAKDIRAIENEIILYDGNTGFNQTTPQYALRFEGGASQTNNLVYANNFNALAGVNNSIIKEGVTLLNTSVYTMKCNGSDSLSSHYLINGAHNPSVFQINNLSPQTYTVGLAQKGLHLANGGIIGTQGSVTYASDNLFSPNSGSTWFNNGNLMSYCNGSNAQFSPFYLRKNNNLYDLSLSSGRNPGSLLPLYTPTNGTVINAPATNRDCPDQEPRPAVIPVGDDLHEINMPNYGEFDFNTEEELIALSSDEMSIKLDEMVALAQGNTLQTNLPEADERLYVQQLQLYLYLKSPNGIKEQRNELQEWVNVCNGNSFGTILNISDAIAINDITTAQNLLNNWNKINKVDENYATYLSWKIDQMQNKSIDINEVEVMSLKCPLTDGSVVIAAQCLYNSLTNEHRLFDNSCGLTYNEEGNRAAITTNTKPLTTNNLLVYPNPSKNFINVLGDDIEEATLIDITGKQLQIQKARANTITFNTSNLLPGLYLIKIKNNKGNIKIEKFVKD